MHISSSRFAGNYLLINFLKEEFFQFHPHEYFMFVRASVQAEMNEFLYTTCILSL